MSQQSILILVGGRLELDWNVLNLLIRGPGGRLNQLQTWIRKCPPFIDPVTCKFEKFPVEAGLVAAESSTEFESRDSDITSLSTDNKASDIFSLVALVDGYLRESDTINTTRLQVVLMIVSS